MAVYTGPKCRLCRREGKKLFLKGERCFSPKCPIENKGAVPPGQHGLVFRRRPSDYGLQLREKQKVKRTYGVLEKQFRRYYTESLKAKGQTGTRLLQILETRLDRVVYAAGLIGAKKQARQFVNHGHVLVNGKKATIPSYALKQGDVISLTPKALESEVIKRYLAKKVDVPTWIERKGPVAKITRIPEREDIDLSIQEQLIVEYYSK